MREYGNSKRDYSPRNGDTPTSGALRIDVPSLYRGKNLSATLPFSLFLYYNKPFLKKSNLIKIWRILKNLKKKCYF